MHLDNFIPSSKPEEDFVRDAVFSLERYLIGRFAKNFGKAEENAFINGTGVDEPTGILHETMVQR